MTIIKNIFFLLPLLLACIYYFHLPNIPGDLMDARFNMYILEHGFRWIDGVDKSFWSASFFYPQSFVTAYSDNLLGSLPFYFLLRKLGQERENAFRVFVIFIFIINYISTYWVLRRWNVGKTGSMGGAYLFTFGLPAMAQINHIQLAPRFMIPFGFYFLFRFLEFKKVKYFYLLLLVIEWQVYIGIYMGYMLFLGILVAFLVVFVRDTGFGKIVNIFRLPFKELLYMCKNNLQKILNVLFLNKIKNFILGVFVFIIVLIPLIIPYLITSRQVGHRNWAEISSMLPRISSYFYGPSSFLYGRLMKFGEVLPLPWEHQLFIGVFPFFSIIFFILLFRMNKQKPKLLRLGFTLVLVLFVLFILTLDIRGLSLYRFISIFPGANAIRSVTRIILVMLFPIAVITAIFIDMMFTILKNKMIKIGFNGWISSVFLGIYSLSVIVFLALDQLSWIPSFSIAEAHSRLQPLETKVLSQMKDNNAREDRIILWINKNDGSQYGIYLTHLDAMLVGQDLGIPVINGYSGNIPPGYGGSLYQLTRGKCSDLSIWIKNNIEKFNKKNILQVGTPCSNSLIK